MPSWNRTDVFRVQAQGVARTQRELSRAEDRIQEAIEDALDDLRRPILKVFEDTSPSVRIAEHLHAVPFFRRGNVGFEVVSTYRDPFTGYDPLGVTRFGHRRKFITPREDRFRSSTIATRKPRGPEAFLDRDTGRFGSQQTALKMRGKPEFRHYAKGQTRRTDWVKDANVEVRPLIGIAADRLGRKITGRIL